jgi:hypothetical protein
MLLKWDTFFRKVKADFVKHVMRMAVDMLNKYNVMAVDVFGSGLFPVTRFDISCAGSLEFCF